MTSNPRLKRFAGNPLVAVATAFACAALFYFVIWILDAGVPALPFVSADDMKACLLDALAEACRTMDKARGMRVWLFGALYLVSFAVSGYVGVRIARYKA